MIQQTACRVAVVEDIPALVEMGRKFHGLSHWNGLAAFDGDSVTLWLGNILFRDDARVFVTEADERITGLLIVLLVPLYFNHALCSAEELDWYSEDPRSAFSLLAAAVEFAREKGAVVFNLGSQHGATTERFARVYDRLGFKPFSHSYSKELH